MSRTFADDYSKGTLHEKEMLPILQEYFKDGLLRLTPPSSIFDYEGDYKFVELKKRNVESYKYPDTMIGLNKIKYCQDKPEDYYFVFSFLDGDYIWKYNNEAKLNYRSGGRRDRGRNEIKDYCYIPINLLKKI